MKQESIPQTLTLKDPNVKKRQPNNHQKIISRFITVEFSAKKRGFWPNEMRLAGQLMAKYGVDFLLWCPPPNGYKETSLVWFLTDPGKQYLSAQLLEYNKQQVSPLTTTNVPVLEQSKVGEDIQPTSKPKTLKDFLNYGKEN